MDKAKLPRERGRDGVSEGREGEREREGGRGGGRARERVPRGMGKGQIGPIWKRKVDVHDPGKYGGITLLSHYVEVAGKIDFAQTWK